MAFQLCSGYHKFLLFIIANILQFSTADKDCSTCDEVSLIQQSVQGIHEHAHLQHVHANLHRLPIDDARLDGGGTPWPLFPVDQAPGELPSQARTEVFVPPDPDDPIGSRCCPEDTQGFWYYNVSNPTLVPFILPKDHPGRADAAVIVIPGGGNSFLAWNKEGTRVAKWLNSIGFSAFVLKYRIPSNDEETGQKDLIDGQRAVSLVRHHASEYGFNASRIGLLGFSAGGEVGAEISNTLDRAYGSIDEVDTNPHKPDFAMLIYGSGNPLFAANAPPTFLAIAQDDQCVSALGAETYYVALSMNPNRHDELHVFAEGRHGYGDCTVYVEGGQWRDVCAWTANAALFLQSVILNFHPGLSSNTSGMLFTRR